MAQEVLKPIMFVGTGSDVGKSIVNTAFCRIFLEDGYNPAPYKAQNMSLNSYATPDGLEIGRAQAVQAEACKLQCTTDMNPVLLKPYGGNKSQVVLNGKPVGNMSAADYFLKNNKQELFNEAKRAFDRLNQEYSPVVLEGAGSISELNLYDRDITNMRMAEYANANVFLIADIDRGGVFASVYGSVMLLPENHRKLIKGIVINKFRGDISLFEEGRKIIKEITGVPVVGVIPYYKDIYIEEEDSVALSKKSNDYCADKINIAVVHINHMSNFTDFNVLERNPSVNLFYASAPEQLQNADIVILPGSKNTIADLIDIRKRGFVNEILKAKESGKKVVGICGGYQMMGQEILDPNGVEGDVERVEGLGLLPAVTILETSKVTEQCTFYYKGSRNRSYGYEIHMGSTQFTDKSEHVNVIDNRGSEGCMVSEKCWGSYIHGIFDNDDVINDLLSGFSVKPVLYNHDKYKQEQYDKLAAHVRSYCDMDMIYKILKPE